MARRGRRGSIRSGTGKMTERILENVSYLRDHPEDAVPQCQGFCPLWCTFRRARRRVRKAHKHRDDPDKLKKMGQRFHPIGRAYCAALRIDLAGKDGLEYFQNVNTPKGKVPIAPWAEAPPPCHVGMQHHHDPMLRLMVALPFVSEGEAIFATESGLVCAHDGTPPDPTLEALVDQLGLRETEPGTYRAPGSEDPDRPHLELTWTEPGISMHLSPPSSGDSAVSVLQSRMLTRSLLDQITVRVHLPALEDPQGSEGQGRTVIDLPEPVLRSYAAGELSDQDLVSEAEQARAARLQAGDKPMVVLDDRIHRPPFEDLIDRLAPEAPMDDVLDAILDRLDRAIVLTKGTSVELLHKLWPDHGEAALVEVLGEQGRELYDPRASPDDLERLAGKVADHRSQQRVDRELPAYGSLPAPVDLVDEVARAYLSGGRSAATQLLTSAPARSHQAIALALVRALGLPSPSWTIEPRERDMAEHLEPYVEDVLEARGDAYHQALQTLLKATGSTADIKRVDSDG